eukprot:gene7576-15535_t
MTARKLARGILGLTAGASGGIAILASYDEGTRRTLQFWSGVFPLYVHYRTVQLLNRDLKILADDVAMKYYEFLHEKYTDQVQELTYRMRGFYLKQAQLMSTQDDFVPPAYMKWVKHTQDNVPSEFGPGEAKTFCATMMTKELGLKFDDIFSDWEEKPLGVASIGEVHKAKLKSTGADVAIKLQLPGIERRFRSDIKTLKSFCWLAMPQHLSAFDEIEKQFCTEFDYQKEGLNLKRARESVMPRWGNQVVIPSPYLEYCSKHVLVMEFLKGVKLVDGVRLQYGRIAEALGMTLEDLEEERKKKIREGTFQFKTILEDSRDISRMRWMSLFYDLFFTANPLKLIYNLSPLALVYGCKSYYHTELPLDLGRLLDILCRVHATELFHEGLFNADPHPGNCLLLEDGRLGLIDYGQVKTMSIDERIKYAKLIIAHSRSDVKEVVRIHFDELGTITKHRNEEIAYLFSSFYNDRMSSDVCGEMNIATFIDWLESQDKMIRLPDEYLMASRVNILLRGMGNAFGLQLRMSQMWAPDAMEFLKNQGIDY